MLHIRAAFFAPGVALHEFSHHLLCLIFGVRVKEAVYFRMGSPAGFVIHEEPELYRQVFAIVVGPLLLNSAASVVLLNTALRQASTASDPIAFAVALVLVWLGTATGLQAVPSQPDARNLLNSSNRHLLQGNLFAIAGYPVALAIYLVQLCRRLGADWFYALLMAYLAYRGFTA